MNRRGALGLFALMGLSGCSFEPIEWVEGTPEAVESADPTVELRPDFFIQTSDNGVKSIEEASSVGQRISTPHFDARLEQVFLGAELGQQTAMQVRRRTPLRAPEGHQILAFTLAAGVPSFQPDPGADLAHRLRVGDVAFDLGAPFVRHTINDDGEYDIDWTLIMLCIPEGSPVFLDVTDQARTVSLDLITGAPVEDEAWADTTGFRERHLIAVQPERQIFVHDIISLPDPSLQIEQDEAQLAVALAPNPTASLLTPWLPGLGWAAAGMQWFRLRLTFEPSLTDTRFTYSFSGPESFTFEDSEGVNHKVVAPEIVAADDIEMSTTVDLIWQLAGPYTVGTMRFQPKGTLQALYTGGVTVAAQFTATPSPLQFGVQFTAREQPQ
ncbi:hypothetical protein [Tessaracoccus sp. MC1756]|uniref:hypothetical protein n=1 Tax=Tessaracoccus sp. MC1756 TaxID=2760311 RepID=UPI001601D040|nr:hypothetical protein [Tessaracoccus sp. MC1756]MBB1509769.1 hypothetical protein [Tessaracoccus sp. MC1756]